MNRIENVKISFYRVQRCGYYGVGEENPRFGNLETVLAELQQWGAGVDLSLTKIADPDPHGKNESYPIYLFGIERQGNDWAIATWNEVPASESGVASVSKTSKVGTAKVHMNQIVKDSIPGFATYFWALPDEGLLATIRFQHAMNGQALMQKYLGRFMAAYTSYAILDEAAPAGTHRVIGYTDLNDKKPQRVRPRFKTAVYSKPGVLDLILKRHADIRKVVRRGHLITQNKVDRDFWQKSIRFLRGSDNAANSVFVKQNAYVELEFTPSLPELENMINAELEDTNTSGWDDLGFVLTGDAGTTHWVGRSGANGDFDLEIDRIDDETVDLQSLLTALQRHKRQIMNLLK